MRVKTALYGIRYFMEEWFFTTAILTVMSMTVGLSLIQIVAILLAKRFYTNSWL